jgi:NAD(P)-dependent dehydrogenase (short-subunit alcohol dehydrogenase family)
MREGQIIVTGGSRGIGASIVERLAAAGFTVAVLSRSGDCPAGYGLVCDVADEASVSAAIRAVAERGPIAGLVNNAGFHEARPSHQITVEEFDRTIRVNTTAAIVASREAYPHLKANGGGLIVNMGSFFDKLGVAGNVAYCASKAAIGAVTRCLAVEWAGDNIRVMNVAPGYIETDLNRDFLAKPRVKDWLSTRVPLKRPGRPDEVAELISTLFERPVGFLTGETIYVDGGQGMNH